MNLVLSGYRCFCRGWYPMMNTPNSVPTSTLQSIGTVCWPFQKGMLSFHLVLLNALHDSALNVCCSRASSYLWSKHACCVISARLADTDLSLVVPPLPPGLLPDVKPQDFNLYKQKFASRLARFEASRNSQFVPRVDSENFIPGMSLLRNVHLHGAILVRASDVPHDIPERRLLYEHEASQARESCQT